MQSALTRILSAAVLTVGAAGGASALTATVTVKSFGNGASANVAGALTEQKDFHTGAGTTGFWHESFEGFAAGATTGATGDFDTTVGTFAPTAPQSCGSACSGVGDGLAIFPNQTPNKNDGGRFAVTGTNWLDSNDYSGLTWEIPGSSTVGQFDRLSFLTTDIDDVGAATFELDGVTTNLFEANNTNRPNGQLLLWTISFTSLVSSEDIAMTIDAGDGFGIDNVKVGVTPLPAAAWLLIAGVGGLFGLRRFQRAAV